MSRYLSYNSQVPFSTLLGKTFVKVSGDGNYDMSFIVSPDEAYVIYHNQECCEDVHLAETIGDLRDLEGSEIIEAEEVRCENYPKPDDVSSYDSYTWTFYKLGTKKGFVTLRWIGVSNGYYSEEVDLYRIGRE